MSTKYFLDCEFSESGPMHPIELISIGLVCEDNREYYAQANWFDLFNANDWIWENVIPHLTMCYGNSNYQALTLPQSHAAHNQGKCNLYTIHNMPDECPWRSREQMVTDILAFMNIDTYGKPEIWAYFGAYDFVLFSQIFGAMVNLPTGFPMLAYDLRQWLDNNQLTEIRQPDDAPHNALEDARWIAKTYKRFHIDTDF